MITLQQDTGSDKLREGEKNIHLKSSLLFFKAGCGQLFHRPRSAKIHVRDGVPRHTSVHFWCGNIGFVVGIREEWNHKQYGSFFAEPAGPCCAVCEGKATGAGLNGERVIRGRRVPYRPKI